MQSQNKKVNINFFKENSVIQTNKVKLFQRHISSFLFTIKKIIKEIEI